MALYCCLSLFPLFHTYAYAYAYVMCKWLPCRGEGFLNIIYDLFPRNLFRISNYRAVEE